MYALRVLALVAVPVCRWQHPNSRLCSGSGFHCVSARVNFTPLCSSLRSSSLLCLSLGLNSGSLMPQNFSWRALMTTPDDCASLTVSNNIIPLLTCTQSVCLSVCLTVYLFVCLTCIRSEFQITVRANPNNSFCMRHFLNACDRPRDIKRASKRNPYPAPFHT